MCATYMRVRVINYTNIALLIINTSIINLNLLLNVSNNHK
jgi:hypothetical protein